MLIVRRPRRLGFHLVALIPKTQSEGHARAGR